MGMTRSFFACVVAATLATACSSSSSGGASSGGPCNPLTPAPVTLGTLLGVGQDSQSTLYVADIAPGTGSPDGQDRVFVSDGKTLVRQHVAGTGQQGGPPNATYTLSFEPASDYGTTSALRSLIIQQAGTGAPVAMALGPGVTKGPGAGDQPLTVVGASAISGYALVNLPVVVAFVGDVSNGGSSVPALGSLDTGSGMLPMTQRTPTPQTLTGFAFTCLGG